MKAKPKGQDVLCRAGEHAVTLEHMGRVRQLVWEMGEKHRRDGLPWRFIDDPYQVYVSEAMLQQTQVSRVLKHWPRFLAAFPTVDALASASVSDVLEEWQGLGYNRRALALKRAADECSAKHGGCMPDTYEELLALPGIGPATAAGIMAFAYQKPGIYIETNVRSVFIHHFFPDSKKVTDSQLRPLVECACDTENPREWYYALLDYGAALKAQGINPNRRSTSYTRQSSFEGSHRQKRSFVLQQVLAQPGIGFEALLASINEFERKAGRDNLLECELTALVEELVGEGFFEREGDGFVSR